MRIRLQAEAEMNNIISLDKADAQANLTTLEDLLRDFTKYGRPRLQCRDDMTWYCTIEIFITGKGIDFKVSSDFKQTTPLNAAQQCHERMRDAMRDISNKVPKS